MVSFLLLRGANAACGEPWVMPPVSTHAAGGAVSPALVCRGRTTLPDWYLTNPVPISGPDGSWQMQDFQGTFNPV